LWLALAWGATLEGRAPELARLAGGVAVGFVLLAAAVVIGSTIVAISGSIGGGVLEVVYTRDERIFTWLLQASTAAALIVTWLLAGTRLGERASLTTTDGAADRLTDDDGEVDPDLVELSDAPLTPRAPADPKPATTSATAQRVFQERLAYSPKRDEARRLLDEIARAERE